MELPRRYGRTRSLCLAFGAISASLSSTLLGFVGGHGQRGCERRDHAALRGSQSHCHLRGNVIQASSERRPPSFIPGLAAVAGIASAASTLRRRRQVALRGTPNPSTDSAGIDEKKIKDGLSTALDIAKNVLFALFDIFKGPPEEATGKDAPGLAALGSGGVVGALRTCQVLNVKDGSFREAGDLCSSPPFSSGTVLLFLTHFGDFNAWEVAQQVRTAMREGRTGSARVAMIGIGSVASGREFAKQLDLPDNLELYADATGSCHQALGFTTGALPQYKENLNPYFRVFLMLLGVGSPGTIRTVLGGYFGDSSLQRDETSWVDEALKQGAQKGRFPTSVPRRLPWEKAPADGGPDWVELASAGSTVWDGRGFGDTGLRPFELATVRLQNMVGGIISNWGKLKPADDELLVQQGGAVVFAGGEVQYFFRDKGILTYVPLSQALKTLK